MQAWIQASRPLAQVNVALPLVFGQALAFSHTGVLDVGLVAWVFIFGVLDQLFIVYSNDVADFESDRANETFNLYSGGSRVLIQGKVTRRQLGVAAVLAALAMGGLCLGLTLAYDRPGTLALWLIALGLMGAYSFPPLRLSYRGGGEVLQGLGIGQVLPLFGYYAQTGQFELPATALLGPVLLGIAGNITTALPDHPSDAKTHKRTVPVIWGQRPARIASLLGITAAALTTPLVLAGRPGWIIAMVTLAPLVFLAINLGGLKNSDAENRRACRWFVTWNGAAISAAFVGWSGALWLS